MDRVGSQTSGLLEADADFRGGRSEITSPLRRSVRCFLCHLEACSLLQRNNHVRTFFPEAAEILLFDELREWQFPGFMPVVIELAKGLGVHAQLSRHLHLRMGEMESLPRLDPDLKTFGNSFTRHVRSFFTPERSMHQSPRPLIPEDRLQEIPAILAHGLPRLRLSAQQQKPLDKLVLLDFLPTQSFHDNPCYRVPGVVMNATTYPTNPSITARIARLSDLGMAEIKAIWKQLFDKEVPTRNRQFLEKRIAYKWQEIEFAKTHPEILERNRQRIEQLMEVAVPAVREGKSIDKSLIYKLLNDCTYLGEIRHKEKWYLGDHEPIIDQKLWDQVQSILAANCRRRMRAGLPLRFGLVQKRGICLSI